MSKGLSQMSPGDRAKAIARRIARKTGGLGYWAAMDARERMKKVEDKREDSN